MNLPRSITVSAGHTGSHLQGIAYDPQAQHLYLSFTTCLLKADLTGRILTRVDGIVGPLMRVQRLHCRDQSYRACR